MRSLVLVMALTLILSGAAFAAEHGGHESKAESNHCVGAGPQAPRDIDLLEGTNPVVFAMAPDTEEMNLCNIHFHRNAEHKSANYSILVEDGVHTGWSCEEPASGRLEMEEAEYEGCEGIAEGDTIEIHWVYTTCDINTEGVEPLGGGLNACLTTMCPNPELKVVARVYTLEKGGEMSFTETPASPDATSVLYVGSTTGPTYNNDHCSPFQVTWDVSKTCDTLDIDDFSKWCSDNEYGENHAHGVRELVTPKKLLSKIKK